MESDGQHFIICEANADTKIVSTALNLAMCNSEDVVIVANDTDIAMMLLYHWSKECDNMIFYQEREQKGWNMSSISQKLGDLREHHLLFVHAWSGCNTVSTTFGKGKATFLNQLKKSEKLKDISIEMNDTWDTQDDIGTASEVLFGMVYGGKPTETWKNYA